MNRRRYIRLATGLLVGLCALAAAPFAAAQTKVGGWTASGYFDLGLRTTWGDDEEAKLLEYRDLDAGFIGDHRLLLNDPSDRYYLRSQAENSGYYDQRYWLEAGRYGHFKVNAFFRELPHLFSTDARSLYARDGESYRLPAGVQPASSASLASALATAARGDLGFRWREGGGGVEAWLAESLRIYSQYRVHDKEGTRARAISWGSPGGNFAVLPLEIDEKIHELRAGGEWLAGKTSLSLEYQGSLFENELRSAVVDNPLVATDSATTASRGRLSLAPDNAAHSLALSGSRPLPLAFPANVVASVVYGMRLQDQSFLPHTINPHPTFNSAGLALPQDDLDGRVDTWLANVRVNLDPRPDLDVDLRYRLYRYDNKSDELLFAEHVRNDDLLEAGERRNVANDYTVQKASANAGYELTERLDGQLGWFWEHWHRSDERQVEDLHEHGPTAKLDYRFTPATSAHASWSFRTRNGDGYDPYAYFDSTLDAAGQGDARSFGELPRLRKYDQADRDTHRIDLQARSLPSERLELSVFTGLQQASYRDTDFGLTGERSWSLGGEAYYQLHPRVGLRGFYDFETIRYEQDARFRPRSFAPPLTAVDNVLNDWSSRIESRFHTTGVQLAIELLQSRVELALGAEFHYGSERTSSSGPVGLVAAAPPTSSGDGGNAVSFPEIEERLHALTADLTMHLSDAVSLVAQYRYEDFDLDDDFRRQGLGPFLAGSNVNGSGAVTPSTDVFLGDELRDYQAHILRLVARIRF